MSGSWNSGLDYKTGFSRHPLAQLELSTCKSNILIPNLTQLNHAQQHKYVEGLIVRAYEDLAGPTPSLTNTEP